MITTLNSRAAVPAWLGPLVSRIRKFDVVVLVMTYDDHFIFNEEEARRLSGKRFVILEMGEYGVDHSYRNNYLPGITLHNHRPVADLMERHKLDEFLKSQKIAICFKREFSRAIQIFVDQGEVYYPVEPIEIFFDNLPPIPELNKDQYMNRVGLIFHLFGNSHPDRKNLAGEMMKRFERICTSIGKQADLVNHRLPFHHVEQIEHVSRYDLQTVLHHQGNCLLSCNLPGFGQKSFRHREACFNALPVMADYGMRYSIPWNEDNAVLLPTSDGRLKLEESMVALESTLRDRENLWLRMQNAHTLAEMYAPDCYVEEQVNRKIERVL